MRVLELGEQHLHIDATAVRRPELQRFINRISVDAGTTPIRYQLYVREGKRAELLVNDHAGIMSLVVPTLTTNMSPVAVNIAILQAAARCLALLAPADRCVLLHGSAVTATRDGVAVAVLDGGLGQGKTSLALGLAKAGYALLVDEFTFATCDREKIVVSPAPRLPWHVRADMAPHLTPKHLNSRLVFPDQLAPVVSAETVAALAVIVVPDRGSPAGELTHVDAAQVGALLAGAVTDHVAKLADPGLDHVSIFTEPHQLRFASGSSLLEHRRQLCTPHQAVLDALSRVPTFRVGIGSPADIASSVEAVRNIVESS